jgi:hypothetical protein
VCGREVIGDLLMGYMGDAYDAAWDMYLHSKGIQLGVQPAALMRSTRWSMNGRTRWLSPAAELWRAADKLEFCEPL